MTIFLRDDMLVKAFKIMDSLRQCPSPYTIDHDIWTVFVLLKNSRPIYKVSRLQKQIDEQGYVVFQLYNSESVCWQTIGAPMHFHYFDKESKTLHRYSQPEDILLRFDDFANDITKRPKLGVILDKTQYRVPQYNRVRLLDLLDSFLRTAGIPGALHLKSWKVLWR
jgi:hypothetical protein